MMTDETYLKICEARKHVETLDEAERLTGIRSKPHTTLQLFDIAMAALETGLNTNDQWLICEAYVYLERARVTLEPPFVPDK